MCEGEEGHIKEIVINVGVDSDQDERYVITYFALDSGSVKMFTLSKTICLFV